MNTLASDAVEGPVTVHHSDDELRHLVEHAAHFLPAQGPIEVFVHHNTLHAFEQEPFSQAVISGMKRFDAQPYFSEKEYRRLFTQGRITRDDLEAVLAEDLGPGAHDAFHGLGSRFEIRMSMLLHPLHIGPDAELRWIVAETDAFERFQPGISAESRQQLLNASRDWMRAHQENASHSGSELTESLDRYGAHFTDWKDSAWESFTLHLLWRICLAGTGVEQESRSSRQFIRRRDLFLRATGEDVDRDVHDVLIRFTAGFIDQGYCGWTLPLRDEGFFRSFCTMYANCGCVCSRSLPALGQELARILKQNVTPETSVQESLAALEIPESDWEEFIVQTLLSIRGWAGMIHQLESGVDWVVHPIPAGSLLQFLAVQLLLERFILQDISQAHLGCCENLSEGIDRAVQRMPQVEKLNRERLAFLLFQLCQMRGWTPQMLSGLDESDWRELSNKVESFNSLERRRIFHEAYERKYYCAALDAISTHTAHQAEHPRKASRPAFQVLTCIDDREESFRRHMEEIDPQCETLGAAGFFAVAINYRGAADGFYKPLCPAVMVPQHFVQEDVGYTFEGLHRNRTELRKQLGQARHLFQTRSRSFVGGIVAGILGSLATAPLVARVLFPRLSSQINQTFGSLIQPPPVTRLQLERYLDPAGPDNGHIGYRVNEMSDVVVRLLQDIGITRSEQFSRLFIICGHGSSSLNNPHESAYCCGACAGKRGGPNARAFAEMANDWRVRAAVAARGIKIPEDTFFVGSYHNTCDDSVVFFDLDRLPSSHRQDFDRARIAIDEARYRNAHERCRRFSSVPIKITPADALKHVEGRAQDISQVRPEYNHATNAMCLVGRREWSRSLYLDRRAFLTSYDPAQDDEDHSILLRILSAAIPVCAGINLEYYFSCVDHRVYGSGSKLPHNIVSLLGVMEGSASDLRTGLYQQMVEIHEPMRLLFVIESTPAAMLSIMDRNPTIGNLCRNGWVRLAVLDGQSGQMQLFQNGQFIPHEISNGHLEWKASSRECYEGCRSHLPFFAISNSEGRS